MDAPLAPRLERDPWIASLDPPTRAAVISAVRPRLLPSGTLVFAQGEQSDGFYGVLGGELRFTRTAADGRRSTLTQVGTGAWVGELSFIDGAPKMHDAHTVGETLLAVVPAGDMHRMLAKYPDLREGLVRNLAAHTRRLYVALDELLIMTPEKLLATRLVERLGTGTMAVDMSQEDIAGLIGVSRQSANRILKMFEKEGIIKRRYRGFDVIDAEALAQVANADGSPQR